MQRTVKICSNLRPDLGYIIINVEDFNPEFHQSYPPVVKDVDEAPKPVDVEVEKSDRDQLDELEIDPAIAKSRRRRPQAITEE